MLTLKRSRGPIYIALLIALCLPQRSMAQGPVTVTDAREVYPLGLHLEILEDPTGQLVLADVTAPAADTRFALSRAQVPNFGYTDSIYWARVRIRHDRGVPSDWWLELDRQRMTSVDLYILTEGQAGFEARHSGDMVPFAMRETAYTALPSFVFRLTFDPHMDYTLYLRFQNDEGMYLPLSLLSPGAMARRNRSEQLGLGFFVGLLLIMIGYNLFLWLSVREVTHLYYVLFITSYLLMHISSNGLIDQHMWLGGQNLSHYTDPLLLALTVSFGLKFADTFLLAQTYAPRLHVASKYLFVGWGILFVLSPVAPPTVLVIPQAILGVLTWLIMVGDGFLSWKKGYRPARYFLLAFGIPLVGALTLTFTRLGVLPINWFTEEITKIGVTLMVLLLALALADRINSLKADTEQAYRRLQGSEHRLRQFLDAMPVGVSVVDRNVHTEYTNRRGQELINPSSKPVRAGAPVSEIIDEFPLYVAGTEQSYPPERLPFARALEGESAYVDDVELARSDGRVPLEVWASPVFDEEGGIGYAIAAFQDISERRQTEQELSQYHEQLEALVEKRTEELQREIEERKKAEGALRRLAITDPLTGLFNRRHWFGLAESQLEQATRYQHSLAVIMTDLDHFKRINDAYGHMVGDEVLVAVAQSLNDSLRMVDILARFGGEEFVILLPETDLDSAQDVAERLREQMASQRINTSKGTLAVTISLGVAEISQEADSSIDELVEWADQALYAAKQSGRNRVEVYSHSTLD